MTAETNAAALAEQITSRLDELLSVRDNISVSACRETILGLLRAGAAKVPDDAVLADAKALRKMLANTQTAVIAALPLLVIDDMPGQIAELLHKTAYMRDLATPPAPDAGVVEPAK